MNPLTPTQSKILSMIQTCIDETGMPPTRAEICQHFGFRSPTAAEDHLKALAKKGVIEILPRTSRGIRVLVNKGLPIVGKVAAGEPILAMENIENHLILADDLFHPKPDYILRVEGDSMRDAGIHDGDLLLVHQNPNPVNGQIVVARLDDEVTVKRYKKNKNSISLIPDNPDYETLRINPRKRSIVIEGVVVGVIRRY